VLKEVYEPKKVFSLSEANKTLPLVSRIIQDIVRAHQELTGESRSAKAAEEESRVQDLGYEIEGYLEELEKIGCSCKDPILGLVDFPARAGDRVVLLCWKMGEPQILYYHDLKAGFAGRKPVGDLFKSSPKTG
jgi:hypothetical protein